MATIYKGDDTSAFGQNFIKINLSGLEGKYISKAIFQCGTVQLVFNRPQFPIYVNFTSEESSQLYEDAECYLQVFDEKGRRQTCGTILKFKTISNF